MKSFLLNLILALLWTFLSSAPSATSFVVGWCMGFVLVAGGQPLFPESTYVRRVWAFAWFMLVFTREFLMSNVSLAAVVLFRPKARIHPGFLTYDLTGLTAFESHVLSHCITLTPGTTSVDLTDGGRTLLVHALDADNPTAVRRGIDRRLREPLLRWTR